MGPVPQAASGTAATAGAPPTGVTPASASRTAVIIIIIIIIVIIIVIIIIIIIILITRISVAEKPQPTREERQETH
jgi:heme/copper-type cytochrome/quinol oxidase subunit 2